MLHLLSSLRIPLMEKSLSLGTEVAGTARMSWAILGSSVQNSPDISCWVNNNFHSQKKFLTAATRNSPMKQKNVRDNSLHHIKTCLLMFFTDFPNILGIYCEKMAKTFFSDWKKFQRLPLGTSLWSQKTSGTQFYIISSLVFLCFLLIFKTF